MKYLCLIFLFASIVGITTSASAGKYKRSDLISASQAQRAGGFKMRVSRIGQVTVKKIIAKKAGKRKCLVHKKALIREIRKKFKRGGGKKGHITPVWIKLLPENDPTHGLVCIFPGSGCNILVYVPT